MSGKCIQCSKGTYQDESGQTMCKQCPFGRTTAYVGSQTQLDCTGNNALLIPFKRTNRLLIAFRHLRSSNALWTNTCSVLIYVKAFSYLIISADTSLKYCC